MPDADPDATLPPDPHPDPDRTRPPGGPPDPPTLTATGSPDDDPAGRPSVPGYEIVRELGRGGMGVVYLAWQVKLNRLVALKMVLAGGHAGPKERLRFLQEAEAVAAVQHPGIVQVYEFGTCGDQPYFALEYCPGGSLAARLAGTPLPPGPAAELVGRVARAVQSAHERGIVHRDLKPDNVLFAADGMPKVADFGLARRAESGSGLTATGAILGTPSYMAPEQATAAKVIGPGADVWALGAILYECLTGRPPFRAATVLDTIMQVTTAEPVPPRQLQPGLPRDLDTICLKCLQKEPRKRYASAAALADDLNRFLAGEPIAARPVSAWERAWKAVRRRPAVAVSGAVAVLAVLVALVVGAFAYVRILGDKVALESAYGQVGVQAHIAETRRAEAEAARHKAQARLEKAVEAVEKTLTRAGTARWARDPALAAERRAVLEDAVAFYEGFRDADAEDPLVRRQAARAYLRVGGLYLLVAEYPKAEAALGKARAVLDRLAADHPGDGGGLADLAETILFTGHAAASSGRYEEGGRRYKEAADVARRAAAARPADDDVRRTLVACLVSYAYYDWTGGGSAVRAFREAVAHADALVARPDAPFPNCALAAYTYTGAGIAEGGGRRGGGAELVGRGAALHARTTPDPDAPAPYRDLYDTTGGVLKLHDAERLEAARQPEQAAGRYREAAAVFDRLLAVYPKAFQYRMYKLRVLLQEIPVLARLGREADVRARRAELLAVEDAIRTDSPDAAFVRYLVAPQRSLALVDKARAGDVAGLDEAADDLLRPLPRMPRTLRVVYNVACALSLASRHGTPAEREARAAKAVRLLTELLGGAFYTGPTNAAHIDADADLDPVRDRADFKAFRAKLPAK